ncbi:MAG: B12-binding domain-containing radical SAM protein [Candidatus Omnitrophica bacterium]|nr:B12-binding domain-containing radical SAM protein [Candidatus Omnitrophota bacterium]MBU1869901.1 B12-binding domain-containing radical SAM protein [Candidatus Omnitrophota bacterium]
MKVVLIRAKPTELKNSRLPLSLSEGVGCVMPLGIASIAAFLRQNNIEVRIIDAESESLSSEEVRKRLRDIKPGLVGISSMTPAFHDDIEIARIAREEGALVVMGGPHVNVMPKAALELKEADFCIIGEGELPMLKLIDAIAGKMPLSEVPGLVYSDKDLNIKANAPYIHENLDELPDPAIDLLPFERYHSIISNGRLATVSVGRGCPFLCGFCFKQPSDSKIRFRNPVLVANEIEQLVSKYGFKEINFVTDTFTVKKEFVEALCNDILRRKINVSWIAPTRVDCVNLSMLKLMKKAGCRSLRFGVESGSEKILKLMNKSTDKEKTVLAFKYAREAGIQSFAYLIIGYLGETEETLRQTFDFVKKIRPDLLMYNIATPLPGTLLFDQAVKAGLVDADYWNKFVLDKNYPRIPYLFNDTDKWIKYGYWDFYFSPHFILKKILEIRPGNIGTYLRAFKGLKGLPR